MKKILILFVFLIASSAYGQKNELVGIIKQNSGQSFLLSLNFSKDSLGVFSGTTTVDPFGPYKTITSVKGIIQEDALLFTELGNLETSIKDTSQRYCFIQTNKLDATRKGDMTYYKGTYVGYDINGMICSEGEIQLSSKSSIKSKTVKKQIKSIAKRRPGSAFATKKESDETLKDKTSKREVITKRKIIKSSEPILLHESIERINWQSQYLKLHLKDSYDEDRDSIAILKSGKLINEIELSKKGKSFNFDIDGDKIVLRIIALNEGYSPPTTLDIMLYDEYCIYRSSIRLEKNQWTEIILTPDT
jgi:hypothetical protein